MTRKILLLGGTGAMGVYLREYLSRQPDTQVYITSRAPQADQDNIHYLCGNAKDLVFLRETLLSVKPDAVVDFMVWNTAEFQQVCPLLVSHTRHYLFLSSYRVFAEENPLTEKSPRLLDVCKDAAYLQTDEYGLTKARQENILRQSGTHNWTILRPCITYSKARFQLGCLEADTVCLRSLQGLPVVLPAEILDKQTTMTWAGDTAQFIAKLILNPQAYTEDFNLATAEHHTWREIASYYGEILGTTLHPVGLKEYTKLFGASYQLQYDRMFNRTLDNRKVLRVTGMTQPELMPLKEGLQRELTAFKQHPVFKNYNMYLNAKMDRLCKAEGKISLRGLSLKNKICYWVFRYPALESLIRFKSVLKRQ